MRFAKFFRRSTRDENELEKKNDNTTPATNRIAARPSTRSLCSGDWYRLYTITTATSTATYVRPCFQKSLARTGLEQVSRSANRLHKRRMLRIGFDFFTEPAHVHIHAPRRHEPLRAPHRVQKLIAREHPVRPRRQEIQQAEFQRAHRHGLGRPRHSIRGGIDSQQSHFDRLFRWRSRIGTPQ